MDSDRLLIVFANLLLCLGGGFMCVCRMTKMNSRVKMVIQLQYTLWFSLFAASAISFTYGEPATLTQFCMSAAMLWFLLSGMKPWRNGPPHYALKGG